ncbi:penicillin-binding protein 2 [Brevundimonas aveniformis]|uniref:penicillin-binding protein 2 n=1 Tax=Brevundimonas aveniformis TaxID=370977 RepID=UPI0024901CE9|nr:penicillin-binding protein 2 [Brevundimonas aveniformis]
MSDRSPIQFNEVNERQGSFLRRTFLLGGVALTGLGVLGARLAHLQIIDQRRYASAAVANRFNDRLQVAPRGLITDRNGVMIAGNRPSFSVSVVRDVTQDLDATLDLIARLLPETAERRRRIIREVNAAPRFVPVPVKTDLTWEEFARVSLFVNELPGVLATMDEVRFYPFGGSFAHTVGYVAKVSDRDVEAVREEGEEPPAIFYHPGFRIGRQGVERSLDKELRGRPGYQRVEVDAEGRVRGEDADGSRAATPGAEVVLTLDADAQNRALEVFEEESGAVVAMDCRTGDILCMASAPSFDPNLFVSGVPSVIYRAWADYERNPLLDKAVGGTYAPGSTFKPVVGMANMLRGGDPNRIIVCNGGYYLGRRFACTGRHGPQDMRNAIKNSCNVYFMTLAVEMGPDPIAEVARNMGFGQIFEIGLGGQRRGLVPDRAWKRENFQGENQRWFAGESPSYGIGQGYLEVNALQLAVYVSRLANGRQKVMPRLVKSVGEAERAQSAFEPLGYDFDKVRVLQEGMEMVTDAGGTGFRNSQLGLGNMRLAGKTGTAQVRNYTTASRGRGGNWADRDHNLFIAYGPIDDPRYAISVIVQHGGRSGGAIAAPKAREIMRTLILKDPELLARVNAPPAPEPDIAPEVTP